MTVNTSSISVIMIDGGFREAFHGIDAFGNQTLSPERYEVLWVEYFDRVRPEAEARIAKYAPCRAVCLNRSEPYHASHCFNAGIRESRGDVLLVVDADVVVEPDFLERALRAHEAAPEAAIYVYRLDEPEAAHREPIDIEHLRQTCVLANPTNYGGCLIIAKQRLVDLNGYELHPVFSGGFHANGREMYTRLKNAGVPIVWHPELRLYHPWHPSTGTSSVNYQMQRVIMEDNERQLPTRPYEGLDPSLNRPLPDHLATQVARIRERAARDDGGPVRRIWKTLRARP